MKRAAGWVQALKALRRMPALARGTEGGLLSAALFTFF